MLNLKVCTNSVQKKKGGKEKMLKGNGSKERYFTM